MNNTLNKPIYFTVYNLTVETSGTYKYEVYDRNSRVIFVGNCYLSAGDTEKTFYANDILSGEKWNAEAIASNPTSESSEVKIHQQYYIKLYIGNNVIQQWFSPVLLAYENPHYLQKLDIELMDWNSEEDTRTLVMMQGAKPNTAPPFVSNIPLIDTTEIGFGVAYEMCSGGYTQKPYVHLNAMSSTGGYQFKNLQKYTPCGSYYFNLHELLFSGGSSVAGQNKWLRFDDSYKIADIDDCYSRYYLLWQDRFGTYVMKGFDKKGQFTENITANTLTDYKGSKRVINNTVTPTFEIKSDVITKDELPYYEAIFVSPYLRLYDTLNDTGYNVVLKNKSLSEKPNLGTKLYQLTLELEADSKTLVY